MAQKLIKRSVGWLTALRDGSDGCFCQFLVIDFVFGLSRGRMDLIFATCLKLIESRDSEIRVVPRAGVEPAR